MAYMVINFMTLMVSFAIKYWDNIKNILFGTPIKKKEVEEKLKTNFEGEKEEKKLN
jgi:hypothetical protein